MIEAGHVITWCDWEMVRFLEVWGPDVADESVDQREARNQGALLQRRGKALRRDDADDV